MSATKLQPAMAGEYRVISVEKTEPPEGAEGKDWYRYIIERAGSTIAGHRRGTAQQVTRHAKAFADDLNARTSGRATSPWAPRPKR